MVIACCLRSLLSTNDCMPTIMSSMRAPPVCRSSNAFTGSELERRRCRHRAPENSCLPPGRTTKTRWRGLQRTSKVSARFLQTHTTHGSLSGLASCWRGTFPASPALAIRERPQASRERAGGGCVKSPSTPNASNIPSGDQTSR